MHEMTKPTMAPPEVWGGAEYTCNRVGDCYLDQAEISGHLRRLNDLDLFAELGIKALRCGVLWERHDADGACWTATDEYLHALRRAGMRPIAGLVHHGSGPLHTSLLDPEFPEKLARYAGKVAARYPWIDAYTPVNEPNTTARFSARFGVWYPHHRSPSSYLRALLHELKATVLSMRAIRAVRSDAQLIQTDDLGCVWGTAELRETAELFTARQWLPFDLLCGQVHQFHPLFRYLRDNGISEHEILWFRDNPCPPDVIGVNYYLTSDRFLDHRTHRYPESRLSGEGSFTDVEAVRVRTEGIQGFEAILLEGHRRYGLPMAITEVHLGDSPEQQIRWMAEAWDAALSAQAAGVRCIAVTFWALLGSYYWNELVTRDNGHYEPGIFALHQGQPVPTELAEVVRQFARGERPQHPALEQAGWWRDSARIFYADPFDATEEQESDYDASTAA